MRIIPPFHSHPRLQVEACLATLAALFAIAPLPAPAVEVAVEAWVQRYSTIVSNAQDRAIKVLTDPHDNIIVTGWTDDNQTGPATLTIKYSETNGSVLWSQRSSHYPVALAVDAAGNVVVTRWSFITGEDCHTSKLAAEDGRVLWEQNNGPGSSTAVNAADTNGNVVVTTGLSTLKYAAEDGRLLWEQISTGPGTAIAVGANGDVVVAGYFYNGTNEDYFTAKHAAADGALLWEQRYNGPADGADRAEAVAVDAGGNVVVAGFSDDSDRSRHYYTAKYAAEDGWLLWEQRSIALDGGHPILAMDGDGNVVVAGFSGYIAKYLADDGLLLWEQSSRTAYDVTTDAAGNVVVTGLSADASFHTVKYAAEDGRLLWEQSYNGPVNYGSAEAVAVDASGNVAVTGWSHNTDLNEDYYTAKYAATDGGLLWEQRYNGPARQPEFGTAVAIDPSGNVVVTGSRTLKYAAEGGNLLWEQISSGAGTDIAVDAAGNVVVIGSSHNGYDWDYFTAKYAAEDGALLWEQYYDSQVGPDYPKAVAVDANGNVVVTGFSIGVGSDSDYYTAKYASTDGALLWEQRYNGPANREDKAAALAIDSSGNVIVTGHSFNTNAYWSSDYYTAKYAAEDGALLWERVYNGPSNVRDRAKAVTVDASGDVVVSGHADYYGNGYDGPITDASFNWYTVKYAATDGALRWERRSDHQANSFYPGEPAISMATDRLGNVLVAGHSSHFPCPPMIPCGGLAGDRYYVAKYAATDGTPQWERHDGNGGAAAAVDADGNVVVTGSSVTTNGSVTTTDFYTAMYLGTTGSLLWERRYNSPANGDDTANALVLGANGSIVVTGTSNNDFATVKYVTYATPVVLSLSVTPEGARLRFTGDAGRTYRLQRTSNPTRPWTTLATLTAPPDGAVEHLDPSPLTSPAFYRIAAP